MADGDKKKRRFGWLRRAALWGLAVVAVLSGGGVLWERWSRWRAPHNYPPPGTLVQLDEGRLHLHCMGEGSPVVVLEAGMGVHASHSWKEVHRTLSTVTRVCAYDRGGLMWSDTFPEPRDANRITTELHAALEAADVPPPYVMVGHSLGGLLIRVYGNRYPDQVAGYVFVDSSHPDQTVRQSPALAASMPSPPAAWLVRLYGSLGIIRLSGLGEDGPIAAHGPMSVVNGLLAEQAALERIMAEARETGPVGDRPVVVLSAGEVPENMPPALRDELVRLKEELQREIAALSTNSDYRVVPDAGHFVHQDAPGEVIQAVTDVVTAVRSGEPL